MLSLKNILITLAGIAYLGMGYIATTVAHPPLITVLLGLVPFGAAAIAASWRSPLRLPLLLLCAAGTGTLIVNLETLRDHVAWLYFIQHVGAMSLLFVTFGSTLMKEHEQALCSRIAAFIAPEPLDANYLRYTWQVTLAWSLYFAVSALLSAVLFFFAPIEAWSVFANFVTPVTLGIMFVGEYLLRVRLMPNAPRVSVSATILAYQKYTQRQYP